MNIQPLNDRILVEPDEPVQKVGSIFVPQNLQEKPLRGTVRAVGTGKMEWGQHVEIKVKVGDRIIYGRYSGLEIEVPGTSDDPVTMLLMRESDVQAIFTE